MQKNNLEMILMTTFRKNVIFKEILIGQSPKMKDLGKKKSKSTAKT